LNGEDPTWNCLDIGQAGNGGFSFGGFNFGGFSFGGFSFGGTGARG
jgi:hypothetical protein